MYETGPKDRFASGNMNDVPVLRIFQRASCSPTLRILAVGDIAFSGRIRQQYEQYGFDRLFAEVAPFFEENDIVFGNLEVPFAPVTAGTFAGSPLGIKALAQAGFSILHLANGHMYDHGPREFLHTLELVERHGILPLGVGRTKTEANNLIYTELKGIRVGWLGSGHTLISQSKVGPFLWELNETELITVIRDARKMVDLLIVSLHTGLMYIDYPDPQDRILAKNLASAGADIILMHHAHVLQGVEQVRPNRFVCYSLGNFLFDWKEGRVTNPRSYQKQRESGIFQFEVDRLGICTVAFFPIWIDDDFQIRWPENQHARSIVSRVNKISEELSGSYETRFHQQRAEWHIEHTIKVLLTNVRQRNLAYIWKSLRRFRLYHLTMMGRWLIKKSKLWDREL